MAEVWNYTPRQVAAFIFIGHRRRKRELHDQLGLQTLAARGDRKAVEKQLKALEE